LPFIGKEKVITEIKYGRDSRVVLIVRSPGSQDCYYDYGCQKKK
jgi:hypothetical protein